MISTKNQIKKILNTILQELNIKYSHIVVEYPENSNHGDYSSPIAMSIAKELKTNPRLIAEQLLSKLTNNPMFSKVEVAGAGFLNFFISEGYLKQKLEQILSDKHFGKNQSLSDKHILLEYISANPTGPLHIGHGRWAAFGDSLARLLTFSGANVFREFYVNDAGVQIKHLRASVDALQQGQAVPEDGYKGAYVQELADLVSQTGQTPEILMQTEQKNTLIKFRTEFDNWFSEKSLHHDQTIADVFKELENKHASYTEDGALWFKSTSYSKDDKDRVMVKSDGSLTYFASDIAYHKNKIDRGFPILINILGFDHHGYVERISAAVHVLGGNLTVLLGQMVNLFRNGQPVRMSKRTGDMISLEEVIDEIGTDAIRYLLLRRPMNSMVDFDLDSAKSTTEDNPVFYIQYAHARISSILAKSNKSEKFDTLSDIYEKQLLLELIKFEDLILDISKSYDLHKIPAYLESVAHLFHRFYKNCRIIDDKHETSRLSLCQATKNILSSGLTLLGVSAPDKMEQKNNAT